MLCGLPTVQQAAIRDGFLFDPFPRSEWSGPARSLIFVARGNPHSRASLQQSPRREASSRNSLRYIGVTSLGTQRPSKTELVTIRVGQVKESLAPSAITRL